MTPNLSGSSCLFRPSYLLGEDFPRDGKFLEEDLVLVGEFGFEMSVFGLQTGGFFLKLAVADAAFVGENE